MVKILADDLHVLTGSYALDALPDPERAEFERHLQHCPSCDAEVRGLRETAARMGDGPGGLAAAGDGTAGAGCRVPDQAAAAAAPRPPSVGS